jgi:twitching motility protein PilT
VFDRIVDPNTTEEIIDVIADGEYYGMQSFDQALVRLVKEGLVTVDDARRASTNPHDFDLALAGVMDRHASAGTADSSGLPF